MASKTKKATNVKVNLQAGTDETYYATWTWTKKHTKEYKIRWYYNTNQDVWFDGTDSSTTSKNSTYTAPSNATKIKFVVKPVAETHKVNKKNTAYWTASWSTAAIVNLGEIPPDKPSTPSVTITNFNLTAEVNYYGSGTKIEFEIVQNDITSLGISSVTVVTNHAAVTKNISVGNTYKVRARAIKGSSNYSEWSEYSSGVDTIPSTPSGITSIVAVSETAVRLTWNGVSNASGYVIEYTDNYDYFDTSSDVHSSSFDGTSTTRNVTGLETGRTWYFRVQASNSKGKSGWCIPSSVTIGKEPSPPTTWSATTTAIAGDTIKLYWTHNSEDNSEQTSAEIEISVNEIVQIISTTTDTNYSVNTNNFQDGSVIKWRVRTKGIINKFSNWSIQRTINVYAPVTLGITGMPSILTSFPFSFSLSPSVSTQLPIGYHVSILSMEAYETTNDIGQDEIIREGQEIFSRYYNDTYNPFVVTLNPEDINLDNNITYKMICTVAMDSGLSSETEIEFV